MAVASAVCPSVFSEAGKPEVRAMLLQLGMDMWCDYFPVGEAKPKLSAKPYRSPSEKVVCKDEVWRKVTDYMAEKGLNLAVIDIGEGLEFPSHPEIRTKGAWSADKMRGEIARLRKMGIEAIPKLNFSTTHNGWMRQYRRMLSTPTYYRFCEDVIRDTAEIFSTPRFFHIGYDEESAQHQLNEGHFNFISARTGDLWKHDYLHIVGAVEKNGVRPWCWSDYGWDHPDFYQWAPKSVLMSNWFYDEAYGGFEISDNNTDDKKILQGYYDLAKHGFEQVPCGTNWCGWKRRQLKCGGDDIMGKLVKLCRRDIPAETLKGFLIAPWKALDGDEKNTAANLRNVELLAEALEA